MRISLEPMDDPEVTQKVPLGEQIRRITQEKGSFANLTEEGLAEDIQSPVETEEKPAEEGLEEGPRQKLIAAVRSALNESALSLDFVSLLISGLRPQSGASSMSPALKRQVPIGTLGCDTIKKEQTSINKTRPGAGWKLIALENASKHLRGSSVRLQGEAEKEARFWNELLQTVMGGEVVVKTNRGKMKGLNVKYGFEESGSTYFGTGTGKLIRGADGSVVFKTKSTQEKKIVRVRSFSGDGEEVGCGFIGAEAQTELQTARNYLFEEELFFQLQQEARTLGAYRVLLESDTIVCESFEGRLEIDFVEESMALGPKDQLAQLLCALLHLILCYYYSENLKKQQSTPEPLESTKKSDQPRIYSILRPLLSHMHQAKLAARAVRLAEMILPNSKIDSTRSIADETVSDILFTPPESHVRITAETEINVLVRSPLSPGAVFIARCDGFKAELYDLTELEMWLKGKALAS